LLKVKGFQVAPAEIEGCLLGHPEIEDSCVVGIPDNYGGDIPLAFVVLSVDALQRIAINPQAGHEIKASIIKVGWHPTYPT
jgi:acyl-coenzyme A synthetase/AMP-(fatty) acid ligase